MSLITNAGIGETRVKKDMQNIYHLDLEKTSYEDFKNGTINEDVILFRSEIVKLPDYPLKEVNGDFICRYSEQLASVENFPEHITGTLDISFTNIRSLQPLPKPDNHPTKMKVDGDFVCTGRGLTENAVRSFCDVGGTIYC